MFESDPKVTKVLQIYARLFCAQVRASPEFGDKVAIYLLENQVYRFAIGFGLTPAYREIEKRQALVPGPSRIPEPVQR